MNILSFPTESRLVYSGTPITVLVSQRACTETPTFGEYFNNIFITCRCQRKMGTWRSYFKSIRDENA